MCQMQHTITQFGLIPGPGSPGSPARGCPYRRVLCARHRGQSEEPEPRTGGLWELRPYEEAGAPSTGGWVVPAPPGIVMVSPPEVPRNAERTQSEGRAAREWR